MLLNSEFTSDVFSLRHWYFFWLQQRRYERGDHYVACSMLFPVTFFFLLKAGGDLDLIIFQPILLLKIGYGLWCYAG